MISQKSYLGNCLIFICSNPLISLLYYVTHLLMLLSVVGIAIALEQMPINASPSGEGDAELNLFSMTTLICAALLMDLIHNLTSAYFDPLLQIREKKRFWNIVTSSDVPKFTLTAAFNILAPSRAQFIYFTELMSGITATIFVLSYLYLKSISVFSISLAFGLGYLLLNLALTDLIGSLYAQRERTEAQRHQIINAINTQARFNRSSFLRSHINEKIQAVRDQQKEIMERRNLWVSLNTSLEIFSYILLISMSLFLSGAEISAQNVAVAALSGLIIRFLSEIAENVRVTRYSYRQLSTFEEDHNLVDGAHNAFQGDSVQQDQPLNIALLATTLEEITDDMSATEVQAFHLALERVGIKSTTPSDKKRLLSNFSFGEQVRILRAWQETNQVSSIPQVFLTSLDKETRQRFQA